MFLSERDAQEEGGHLLGRDFDVFSKGRSGDVGGGGGMADIKSLPGEPPQEEVEFRGNSYRIPRRNYPRESLRADEGH